MLLVLIANRTCSDEEFGCSNSVCIDSSMVCDSINDCGDASDEYDSVCGKQITARLAITSLSVFCTFFHVFNFVLSFVNARVQRVK